MIMDLGQQTAAFPRAIVVVDAGPRGQILWHITPLAARFVDIKNPVEDFQVRVLSGSAKGRGFGETVGNEGPFGRSASGCLSTGADHGPVAPRPDLSGSDHGGIRTGGNWREDVYLPPQERYHHHGNLSD